MRVDIVSLIILSLSLLSSHTSIDFGFPLNSHLQIIPILPFLYQTTSSHLSIPPNLVLPHMTILFIHPMLPFTTLLRRKKFIKLYSLYFMDSQELYLVESLHLVVLQQLLYKTSPCLRYYTSYLWCPIWINDQIVHWLVYILACRSVHFCNYVTRARAQLWDVSPLVVLLCWVL